MKFGRVEGVMRQDETQLWLTVTLETGASLDVIREGQVALLDLPSGKDLSWLADQYTQETIANELAEEGWEVIGEGAVPDNPQHGLFRSAPYAVRLL